jgi:hypothetical protein
MTAQAFQIAPAASKAMWGLAIVPGAILILVVSLLATSAVGARSATFEVSHQGLRLRGDSLVLSPSDPEAFLWAVRQFSGH